MQPGYRGQVRRNQRPLGSASQLDFGTYVPGRVEVAAAQTRMPWEEKRFQECVPPVGGSMAGPRSPGPLAVVGCRWLVRGWLGRNRCGLVVVLGLDLVCPN